MHHYHRLRLWLLPAAVLLSGCAADDSSPVAPEPPGRITVTVNTSGLEPDDGYSVTIAGLSPRSVGATGMVTFDSVPAGPVTVSLGDVALNCNVPEGFQRTAEVSSGAEVMIAYSIVCVRSVAFVVERQGDNGDEIFTIASDGSRSVRLTNNIVDDYQPVFSPDGTKIAFMRLNFRANVFMMNADGSDQHRVTDDLVDYWDPAWSPDGSKIVMARRSVTGTAIYVMNADGTGLTAVTPGTTIDQQPSFSPNGSRIVFSSDRTGTYQLYTIAVTGTDLVRVTNGSSDDLAPSFSKDGSSILFVRNSDIYIMNTSGGPATALTTQPASDFAPRFSPDGTKILFTSDRYGTAEILIMNADGSNVTRLTTNAVNDWWADWRP